MDTGVDALEAWRNLTADDQVEVNDVLDAAADWAQMGMPIGAFGHVGTMIPPGHDHPSAPYTRYVAVRVTPKNDPRRGDLLAALAELVRYHGWQFTNHGIFGAEELSGSGCVIRSRPE